MITENLKKLVLIEANLIKENATIDEINNLDIEYLTPNDMMACVYGMMTGCCYSQRAHELIMLCAVPYSSKLYEKTKYIPKMFHKNQNDRPFTALEFYIAQIESNNLGLIEYLKGEIQTIEL